MTATTVDFAADRRAAQDQAIEDLSPAIADALEQREAEPAGSEEWTALVVAAAALIYASTWEQETELPVPPELGAFENTIRVRLMEATRDPNRAAQINRLALWIGVASINAAVVDAASLDPTAVALEWVTMRDSSVREIHRDAQGQRRAIGEPFNIGGTQLDYPGQPVGPPHIWIECRCSLRIVREETEMTEALVAATMPWQESDWRGGMVALKPADPSAVAVDAGDPAEEMHVTLFFLGEDVTGLPEPAVQAIHSGADRASRMLPTTVRIAGVGKLGDSDTTVLFLNGDGLETVRRALVSDMHDYGSEAYPEQHQPWLPHMTLGQGLDPNDYQDLIGREIEMGSVDVHLANDVTSYPATDTPGEDVEVDEEEVDVEDGEPEPVAESPVDGVPWYGVLAPEGAWSGDGRSLVAGEMRWRELPLPLKWQKAQAQGHTGSVVVGRIDKIWRDGDLLKANGVFFNTEDAGHAVGQVAEGIRGVSVDVDDASFEIDDPDGDQPKVRIAGRISAATLCAIGAFSQAFVRLGTWEESDGDVIEPDAMVAAALDEMAIVDTSWDGSAGRFTPEEWRKSTILHRKPAEGQDPLSKSLHSLPILEPNGDLNRNAVHAAAGRINQVKDATPAELAAAKRALRSAYNRLNEDAPEGVSASAVTSEFRRGPGWVTNPEDTRRLWTYWTRGAGAAKIRWGTEGSFRRCQAELGKYVPAQYLDQTCFTGDTEFLTHDGVMTLGEAAGTTQLVLTHDAPTASGRASVSKAGRWVEAEVRSFGEQEVLAVTLRRGVETKTIRATREHSWLASSHRNVDRPSKRLTTEQLMPGMRLASLMPMPVAKRRSLPSPVGVAAGVVFGDGSAKHANTGALVDLMGAKADYLLPYFAMCTQHPTKEDREVSGIRVTGLPNSWKNRPTLDEGFSYLLGWLAGYVATDGTVDKNGGVQLSSAKRENLEFAATVANRLGISTMRITAYDRLGINQTEPSTLYRMGFVTETFPDLALLNPEHRRRFNAVNHGFSKTRWTVESVEETGEAEEVFCAVVPDTQTFALADYVWVFNCAEWYHDATGIWPGRKRGDLVWDAALAASIGVQAVTDVDGDALVASLAPGDWFSNPNLTAPTAPTLEDCGHYYGHIATWDQCHLGYPGICKTAPRSAADYAYFHTGVVRTASGEVAVGQVTLGTGHANLRLNSNETLAHYDNTGTAVADVVVGEDEFGIWFSGALRDLDEKTMVDLRGAGLSGDWRKIRGNLELVAALAVNVPAFPVPRTGLHVIDGKQVSLVASGVLVPEADLELTRETKENVLAFMGRVERMKTLRSRARHQRLAMLRQMIRQ